MCQHIDQISEETRQHLHRARHSPRTRLWHALGHLTNRELTAAHFAELYAQSVVCGALAYHGTCHPQFSSRAEHVDSLAGPLFENLLRECRRLGSGETHRGHLIQDLSREWTATDSPDESGREDAVLRFYEELLQFRQKQTRHRLGVFYTPRPLARFLVLQADRVLREQFALEDGLADTTTWSERRQSTADGPHAPEPDESRPFVRILDPAAGTGVFLTETIACIHATLSRKWQLAGHAAPTSRALWNQYVATHLLPRLAGIELLLPACVVAIYRVVQSLAQTGYDFSAPTRIPIAVADALAGPQARHERQLPSGIVTDEVEFAHRLRYEFGATVVLGNPPYSAVSDNRSEWIAQLMRPREPAVDSGYYQVHGLPLGERKLWLQDDYVKFFRYAQWCVDQSGYGVVALVTNHGYLDNASFRGMRRQLVQAFPHIVILDLHGNRNKCERAPGGGRDENVFAIGAGVAAGVLSRPWRSHRRSVAYHDLWGTRADKLQRLAGATLPSAQPIEPEAPHYLLRPRRAADCPAYEAGFRICDAMPVFSTAVVTARDRFVVDCSRTALLERLRLFRDLRVPDAEIRQRFFTRGRSKNYAAGDTRGWSLAAARRRMAHDDCWDQHIHDCLYRPFDRRWIYWTDWMIDWPRTETMRHLLRPGNLALVTRRQMLPTQPCNFFWVADTVILDGLIRSDNRGSESFFPLHLAPQGSSARDRGDGSTANFSPPFLDAVRTATGLDYSEGQPQDAPNAFTGEDLFGYVYGLFHAPTYRQRYAEPLTVDFPKILVPWSPGLFRSVSVLGHRLIRCHRLSQSGDRPSSQEATIPATSKGGGTVLLRSGYPRYESGCIWLDSNVAIDKVAPEAWEYRVGAHQVCRKWLRDRSGSALGANDLDYYAQLVAAVAETLVISRELDSTIELYGGWPGAFFQPANRP